MLNQNLTIAAGDVVCDLHFWNEHLTQILDTRLGLGKAVRLRKQLKESLRLLAQHVATDAEMSHVRAFHARTAFLLREPDERLGIVAQGYGFTVTKYSTSTLGTIHDVLENILIHALTWTFNASYEIKISEVRNPYRVHLWMSREKLLKIYLQGGASYSIVKRQEKDQAVDDMENAAVAMQEPEVDTSIHENGSTSVTVSVKEFTVQ